MKIKTYSTINLPVVLYQCDISSLVLREEDELRLYENRALGQVFDPKIEEVTEGSENYINETLHHFYLSPDIIAMMTSRTMRWAGHVRRMEGEDTNFW
jgi:hypothetical protein